MSIFTNITKLFISYILVSSLFAVSWSDFQDNGDATQSINITWPANNTSNISIDDLFQFNGGNDGCEDLSQEECEESSNGCGWSGSYCIEHCDDCECAMYSDQVGCESHDGDGHYCYWEDNLCHDENSAPPECIFDCPDFELIDNDGGVNTPDEFCTVLVGWGTDGCLDDCSADDNYEFGMFIYMCEACLEDGDCEELFGDECGDCHDDCYYSNNDASECHDNCDENYCDDGGDDGCDAECCVDGFADNDCDGYCDCCTISNNEDCNDSGCWWVVGSDYPDGMCLTESEANDNGDGPPDCVLDCPNFDAIDDGNYESADALCMDLILWETDGCLGDCDEENVAYIGEFIGICTECLEVGNCDEMLADDDGPPECMLDCGEFGNIFDDPAEVGQFDYCNELTAFDAKCLSDCDDDFQGFFNMILFQCEECLEDNNCECYFVDEAPEGCDDGGSDECDECHMACGGSGDCGQCHNDCNYFDDTEECHEACENNICATCHDDCDDNYCDEGGEGPPECIMDCPDIDLLDGENNPDLTEDQFCNILVSWDGDDCLSDCSDEVCDDCEDSDLEEIMEMIGECSECLAAGNCDSCVDCHDNCEDQQCHDDCDENYCNNGDGDDCDDNDEFLCHDWDGDSCIEGQCYTPCENGDDCDNDEACCDEGESGCEPGFCYEEGSMFPECVMDCSGADQATNAYMYYNGDGFCTILAGWYGDSCLDDCGPFDFAQVNLFIGYCTDCLAADNCGQPWGCDDENGTSWYSHEEECEENCETDCYDSGGDGNDGGDAPACVEDCVDLELVDDCLSNGDFDCACNQVLLWDDDVCTVDCDDDIDYLKTVEDCTDCLADEGIDCCEAFFCDGGDDGGDDDDCSDGWGCDHEGGGIIWYDSEDDCNNDCDSECFFEDDCDNDAPECIMNCPGLDSLGEDSGVEDFCTLLLSWENDSCLDNCDDGEIEELEMYFMVCSCVNFNNDELACIEAGCDWDDDCAGLSEQDCGSDYECNWDSENSECNFNEGYLACIYEGEEDECDMCHDTCYYYGDSQECHDNCDDMYCDDGEGFDCHSIDCSNFETGNCNPPEDVPWPDCDGWCYDNDIECISIGEIACDQIPTEEACNWGSQNWHPQDNGGCIWENDSCISAGDGDDACGACHGECGDSNDCVVCILCGDECGDDENCQANNSNCIDCNNFGDYECNQCHEDCNIDECGVCDDYDFSFIEDVNSAEECEAFAQESGSPYANCFEDADSFCIEPGCYYGNWGGDDKYYEYQAFDGGCDDSDECSDCHDQCGDDDQCHANCDHDYCGGDGDDTPDCLSDCPAFDDLDFGSEESACGWVNENNILEDGCMSDCDFGIIFLIELSCSYCADGSDNDCSWLGDDDEECNDCHDDCYYSGNPQECHDDCNNEYYCDENDDNGGDCVEDACGDAVVNPDEHGGTAFCEWIYAGDACLDGCVDELSQFIGFCDYCTNTNLIDNACDELFTMFDEGDDDCSDGWGCDHEGGISWYDSEQDCNDHCDSECFYEDDCDGNDGCDECHDVCGYSGNCGVCHDECNWNDDTEECHNACYDICAPCHDDCNENYCDNDDDHMCEDESACNTGDEGDCYYYVDCANECGGADWDCGWFGLDQDIVGSWDAGSSIYYENGDCSGDGIDETGIPGIPNSATFYDDGTAAYTILMGDSCGSNNDCMNPFEGYICEGDLSSGPPYETMENCDDECDTSCSFGNIMGDGAGTYCIDSMCEAMLPLTWSTAVNDTLGISTLYVNNVIFGSTTMEYYFDDGSCAEAAGSSCLVTEESGGMDCSVIEWISYEIMAGDVNFDGVLDILDIVVGIAIILGNTESTDEQITALDVNEDNNINVLDIVEMINYILDN